MNLEQANSHIQISIVLLDWYGPCLRLGPVEPGEIWGEVSVREQKLLTRKRVDIPDFPNTSASRKIGQNSNVNVLYLT